MRDVYEHVRPERRHLFLASDEVRSLACRNDLWINAPHAQRVVDKISMMLKVKNKVQAPCLLVFGRGGSGKTTIIQRLQSMSEHTNENLVFVNMRQNPNNWAFRELLFSAFDIAVTKRARATLDISAQLRMMITSRNIKGIVIDEVHDALTLTAVQQKINLSLLKNLSGADYNLSVFAFGTEGAEEVLRADPQLARRYAMHALQDWQWSEEFRNFVASYTSFLPLKKITDLSQKTLLRAMFNNSKGIMDNLVKLMQVCASAAVIDGAECIDLDHVNNISSLCHEFGVAWE
ncbi:AAA family ATPase [Pseudomonas fragi]|uniref:TniB family NTP-binding protein n=1 Tax=Pseudomonas fragi TaxID=296 RepID=UPI001475632A|nr:TniB family NTP-binding protein [Pseudomonas fragi]NNB06629.1 AAA family ATPase [Pseudomonas fragi]